MIPTAEDIVRALAAQDNPIVEGYDTCIFCEAKLGSGWANDECDAEHSPECPYRQAMEWIAANPAPSCSSAPTSG